MPFDRMLRIVDAWAGSKGRRDVFAQIGPNGWRPRHIDSEPFLSPQEFTRRIREADVIVSHAGMGSILSGLRAGKPILVFPRREAEGETRSDHQVATALRMAESGWLTAALDEDELCASLARIDDLPAPLRKIGEFGQSRLLETIRSFIQDDAGGSCTAADGDHQSPRGSICGGSEVL